MMAHLRKAIHHENESSQQTHTLYRKKYFATGKKKVSSHLTFINSSKAAVVHLIRAVEDDHILAKSLPHVLGCLRLAGSCRPGGARAHAHAQRLGQRDVAPTG